jgi:anti-anti-sigma factor
MQARFRQEADIAIIELFGRVEIESSDSFKKNCLDKLQGQKVIFDLAGLHFVGSTGILAFLESLQEFAMQNPQMFKMSHVGSEFKKIFAATSLSCIDIFENIQMAVTAYHMIETTENQVGHIMPFRREVSIFKDLDIIETAVAQAEELQFDNKTLTEQIFENKDN